MDSNNRRLGLILALARERGWEIPPQWTGGTPDSTPSGVLGELWTRISAEDQEAFALELAIVEGNPARTEALLGSVAAPEEVSVVFAKASTKRFPGSSSGKPEAAEAPRGRYEVKREHARGGMGRVLVVVDHEVGREVALKELLPHLAHGFFWDRERFLREARITGQLEHPNIVPVYEIGAGEDGGATYYTMKLVRGETMEERLAKITTDALLSRRQKLAERLKLLDAFIDTCNALAYAHARGIVNRDLKPANIMIGDFGETVVLDWGLARKLGAEEEPPPERRPGSAPGSGGRTGDTTRLTLDGDVMGTPAYMSPEQARGANEQVDEKSDVYALGVMLFEILTGRPPFDGESGIKILLAVIEQTPPDADAIEPDAPRELAAVTRAAMEKDRSKRLGSAQTLAEEVRAWRDGRPMTLYRHTAMEQLRRFARRNRALSVAVAAALSILVAGTIVSLTYAGIASDRADSEKKASASEYEARLLAEARAQDARAALRLAQGQRMAAYSINLLEENTTAALLVAIEAARRAPGAASTNALWSALSRLVERRRFLGHDHNVTDGSFSPDGRYVVTAGADFTARIWDVSTGQEVRRIDAHRSGLFRAEWSADGRTILTVPALSNDERTRPYQPPGSLDVAPRIWDAATGECLRILRGHTGALCDGFMLPDGSVFTSSEDRTVRVWDTEGRATVFVSPGVVRYPAVSRDGRWVAALHETGAILWSAGEPERPRAVPGHSAQISSVSFTPDSKHVISTSFDGLVVMSDLATLKVVTRFRPSRIDASGARVDARNVALGVMKADGSRFALHADTGLHIMEPDLSREISRVDFDNGSLDYRMFNRDWTQIAMMSEAIAWSRNTTTGADSVVLRGHEYKIEFARFTPDGRRLLTGGRDRAVILWDLEPGACLPSFRWHAGREGAVLSPDGTRVLVRGADGRIELHNNATGELLGTWDCPPNLREMRFLPGSRRFVIWPHKAKSLTVVDPVGGVTLTIDGGGVEVGWPLGSSNGEHLFVENTEGDGRIWNLVTGEAGLVIPAPPRTYDFAAVSPDGRRYAAARSSDAVVLIHSTADGSELFRLTGHTGWTIGCGFAPDGTFLTTAMDASIRAWDPATAAPLHSGRWPLVQETWIRVPVHGTSIAVTSGHSSRFYRLDTLDEIAALPRALDGSAEFTPDGRFTALHRGPVVHHLPMDALAFAETVVPRELTPLENERMSDSRSDAEAYTQAYYVRHPRVASFVARGNRALKAGKLEEALAQAQKAVAALPNHPEAYTLIADVHAARASLLKEADPARAAAIEEGMGALEAAVARGYRDVATLEQEPALTVLRSHPRWAALVALAKKEPWE